MATRYEDMTVHNDFACLNGDPVKARPIKHTKAWYEAAGNGKCPTCHTEPVFKEIKE